MNDNRWASRVIVRQPRIFQRGREKPGLRWRDEIAARIPPGVATIDFQYLSFRHSVRVATASGTLSEI